MSLISAPVLLRVPRNFSPGWQRVFECLVSPIHLVRAIREKAHRTSVREPRLSEEELQTFRTVANSIDRQLLKTLDELHGVPHKYKTWLVGQNLRDHAQLSLFPLWDLELLDRTPHPSHREHLLAEVRKGVIASSSKLRQIPLLKKLLKAMTKEADFDLPSSSGDKSIGIAACLAHAIDDLLAFVQECEAEYGGIPGPKMPRFQELDRAVIIPAYSTELSCLLPAKDRFAHLLEEEATKPAAFIGSTNLPGDFDNGLFLCALESWAVQMATLREFAERAAGVDTPSKTPALIDDESSGPALVDDDRSAPALVDDESSEPQKTPRRRPNADRDEWISSQLGSASAIKRKLDNMIATTHSHWKTVKANRIGQIRSQQPQ